MIDWFCDCLGAVLGPPLDVLLGPPEVVTPVEYYVFRADDGSEWGVEVESGAAYPYKGDRV